MVDCNVNEPMLSDKDRKESSSMDPILPIASISATNPQICASQQSPRSPPPILLDNFKNGNTKWVWSAYEKKRLQKVYARK